MNVTLKKSSEERILRRELSTVSYVDNTSENLTAEATIGSALGGVVRSGGVGAAERTG